MTDLNEKALEAAAAEAFKWIGLAANVHWADPHVDEGRKNIWRSAMRKAIGVYLSALVQDEATVERVARAICEYDGGPLPEKFEFGTHPMGMARAALSALANKDTQP